ncbi:pentatricopeptide repeat-containing protein At1g03560, mitochondrial [Cannabis sativa]|uniref:pentatricopeptide repeat-containing protein At1g03560, mitochondrial n=1 Tax=Cannabis sativa TaxID=3483 RepID=UPI0029CAA750|nr:pentatricopeptide repeat-containing protein At1g03560, mitochondrial [Cannabis sativa]
MYLKGLIFGKVAMNKVSRINGRRFLCSFAISAPLNYSSVAHSSRPLRNFNKEFESWNWRGIHSSPSTELMSYQSANDLILGFEDHAEEEEDGVINEFLSRFVWIMRGKLTDSYPDFNKETIDGMLLVIVEKVVLEIEKGGVEQMLGSSAESTTASQEFSEDLWITVWEVSNMVMDDMKKAVKKEKMKGFLQCEEVKELCRFAGEIGIRGDMLRELRFKWAREKMEESEFYQGLERLRDEAKAQDEQGEEAVADGAEAAVVVGAEEEDKPKAVSLPKRRGKIRYKIYGLDLSDPKWAMVADKVNEAAEVIWPEEPKPISGECKLVTDKIVSLTEKDDPSPLLAEWAELLQPSKVDWTNLLDRLKEQNTELYFKVAELLLSEKSFQANIRDYSKLIDAHAKENRLEDAERILKKMTENGIMPDILTATVLVHMYSKVGNLERAEEAYESLRAQGFQLDFNLYNSMIMAYVNAKQPGKAHKIVRDMEASNINPTEEMYMAVFRSFSHKGDCIGALNISSSLLCAGYQVNAETCKLLVEAYGKAGESVNARNYFDHLRKLGEMPDDECTGNMISAYQVKNQLGLALELLLQLEKDGFEPGVATYTVLVDWLGKLKLVEEAEQVVAKISELGEAPPLKLHVSLCDMYSKAGIEKKALQALGVLEARKEELGQGEFERIIDGLVAGGFQQQARRMGQLMEAQGFTISDPLKVKLMAKQTFQSTGQTFQRTRRTRV